MPRVLMVAVALLSVPGAAAAQRLTSLGLATGATLSETTYATAAFSASATVQMGISWLLLAQRSVAEVQGNDMPGTQRNVSLAVMPVWQPLHARLFVTGGLSINRRNTSDIGEPDVEKTKLGAVGLAGVRVPLAGDGVLLELTARVDDQATTMVSALLGVRARLGVPNTLKLGEPQYAQAATARAAAWNEVVMQLSLLQPSLDSFTRIREIETGIEVEFESGRVTLWDDVAKVARILAAAQPPVTITAFGPNAGRVTAAVTAGSFPAERVKPIQAARVYLRVEH